MKISVGLCTYNGEQHLHKQLDSIVTQTRKVDEIIVYDDRSSDNTWQILQDYQRKYPFLFHVKKNVKNLKSVKNFEQVLKVCTGDIVFLSDHDDIWAPQKVERYISYFEKSPNTKVLCSNGHLIDEDGKVVDALTVWDVPKILKERDGNINYFASMCYGGNIATGASMAIKKDYIQHILPIPLMEDFHHDEWIALISSHENCFDSINEKLFYYRIHNQQQVGIISYPNTASSRNNLYWNFSPLQDLSFSTIKRRIKKISLKYNRLLKAKENPLMKNVLDDLTRTYYDLSRELVKKHPIRGRLTILIDKLLNKRQLIK
ncbi:glycosyltransferase [Sphingobacterium phlebotomi]|uniref:Glycosyltransferase n=1 Tax=Sphingobacterium phlebotomi TaxID=2605433 RepID=A0A5D4HEL4_9SPHI|nr:glycosyltransferase [Sphingobacterium phlebotomi]TYR38239.1 glycosyltransferase [Sphingobacterium phlebotomi]